MCFLMTYSSLQFSGVLFIRVIYIYNFSFYLQQLLSWSLIFSYPFCYPVCYVKIVKKLLNMLFVCMSIWI